MRSLREEGDAAHDGLARLVRGDADAIVEMLAASRLAGPFVGLADGTPVFAALPEEARGELRAACLRQREVNAGYLRLLAEYTDLLEREGVGVLLLKGLHIAQRFHGTLDQRFMWDADALVQPADYQRAIRLAAGLGMRVRGRNSPRWLLRLASLHATEVRREAQSIDIHWCLRARPGYRIDYGGVWSRACAMEIGGHNFRVLSDEDALLLAVLEMASDMERSRIKLRSLWDFYLMLAALDDTLDWPAFLERRRAEGLLPLCVNMLSFGLFCLDGHGTFPGVAGALESYRPLLTLDSADTARAILGRPRKHLANRSVYAGLQPAPTPLYWLHRAVTSPLRKVLS
jgi:hypothetical protein